MHTLAPKVGIAVVVDMRLNMRPVVVDMTLAVVDKTVAVGTAPVVALNTGTSEGHDGVLQGGHYKTAIP